MFSNLIQNYPSKTTHQQRQILVREVLGQVKSSELPSIHEQLQSQQDKIFDILKNHPQLTVEFIFQKLTVEDSIRLMKNLDQIEPIKENSLLRLLDGIGKNVEQKNDKQFIQWFSKMYTKYSSLEKVIIFMRQLVYNYVQKFNDQFLPEFFADFINSSRLVIETYLKLKAQSPKFDVDYMEHGEHITKWTETWLRNFYVQVLKSIRVPESKLLKLALLNAVCDIIGAVMEVQRQGNIQFEICSQILSECLRYTKKLTTLDDFNKIYLDRLKLSGFDIPNQKIIIPNRYPSNTITFPKQAYGLIVFNFLKESTQIYSDQLILNYLIPVINELSGFEYQIKTEVQNLFVEKLTSNQVTIKTCFESNFPLSILYFNIWHYQEKRNKVILFALEKLYDKIKLQSPSTFVNNLKILSNLHIENLENQINQFIGLKAFAVSESNPELLVQLVKQVSWKNTNEKGEKSWKEVIQSMGKKLEVKQQVERVLRQREKRNKFQNQMLQLVSN